MRSHLQVARAKSSGPCCTRRQHRLAHRSTQLSQHHRFCCQLGWAVRAAQNRLKQMSELNKAGRAVIMRHSTPNCCVQFAHDLSNTDVKPTQCAQKNNLRLRATTPACSLAALDALLASMHEPRLSFLAVAPGRAGAADKAVQAPATASCSQHHKLFKLPLPLISAMCCREISWQMR